MNKNELILNTQLVSDIKQRVRQSQHRVDLSANADEHLPAEKFRKYRFAFPPMSEQIAIVDFLNKELDSFYTLTAEAERAIELLQERRTALISAAVTGKIDVRGLLETERS